MPRPAASRLPWTGTLVDFPPCPAAASPSCAPTWCGSARSPTTWTGSWSQLQRADLFVSIGTSGAVYPAAGFVQYAARHGARTLELNLQPSEGTSFFHESRQGPAGELVPAWVDEVLADRMH